MDLFFVLIGFVLIIYGANILTDGAAAAALRFKVSEYVVGLTVVAVGTSMPEMAVSLLSALDGNSTLSIGNVVGSNIFNTLIALGLCALIRPVIYSTENIRRDIPFGILASLILMIATFNGVIHRSYGVVMLLIYIAIIFNSIVRSKRSITANIASENLPETEVESMPAWRMIVMITGGFVALIYGGDLLLDGAISFATRHGISEKVISITMLAGGTSLPELAATIIALVKGKNGIALGGIIGSNIANILLVLGLSSTITPLGIGAITPLDFGVVLLSSLLLLAVVYTPPFKRISRLDGAVFIAIYVAYMWYNLSAN
ncbi:MAG: calcium/sodium antiporter [Rikenellaceae bacterium]